MIAKYYVAVRPQTNENHAVHKEGCPFLPDDDKRIYLGEFISGYEAVSESQHFFSKTKGCLFCSRDHKIPDRALSSLLWSENGNEAGKLELPVSYHQSRICCLN